MNLFTRIASTATRVIRDVAQAPAVARQLAELRTTSPATRPAPRTVHVDIDPANTPDLEDIALAAKEFEAARTEANAAARLRRRAEKVLRRTPSGTHGAVTVERVESSRQTADLDAIRALFAAHGLGDVPMKQCAPSIVVTFADDQAPADEAPQLVAAA
ncbi:hypothetical protein DFP74_5762 [Nocardiopsis sp. Huas11]|uniref:hypothetical protein n=1 Tax=Nocardiopsis sp. Huas11 TaxID=2183912 RepID=UPI000EB23357|nr:hypothetical protein [Nocardiopsis sp. Huas11]RKS10016.1 hypothetical protein DFP74_5762 [Nocardiopsis sp. Huas11]